MENTLNISIVTSLPVHTQRIPANVKDLIICDVNADGSTELVISLTDRVVRTYRRVSSPSFPPSPPSSLAGSPESTVSDCQSPNTGRLVSVNKWEFASQIGTVTLNTDTDGSPSLLVSQPGGAFMKLRCSQKTDMGDQGDTSSEGQGEMDDVLSNMSVEYEPLVVHRRRNPNVSAEILPIPGEAKAKAMPGRLYNYIHTRNNKNK